VVIEPSSEGLRVEIRPLTRTRYGRTRLAAFSAVVLVSALFAAARLGEAWESGLRAGRFQDLPLSALAALTLAIGVSAPLAFIGLSALAFAEETIVAGPEAVTIETAIFERTRVRRIPLSEIRCWRETYLPLPPWWTWAVKRLAIRLEGRFEPVAGAVGPKEKRLIGIALARATGKPLVDDRGRTIS
jgi:hypothetical protein